MDVDDGAGVAIEDVGSDVVSTVFIDGAGDVTETGGLEGGGISLGIGVPPTGGNVVGVPTGGFETPVGK